GDAAVLVVDLGIDVTGISLHDYVGRGLKILLAPGAQSKTPRLHRMDFRSRMERQRHEQSREAAKSTPDKWRCGAAAVMQQQLRFDAPNAGRMLQRLGHVAEQAFSQRILEMPGGEHVADHTLAAFIHKEGIADHPPSIGSGVTRQNFGIEITQDHLGTALIIPVHAFRPKARLFHQQRTQFVRAEMSEIDDFHGSKRRNVADPFHGCCAFGFSQWHDSGHRSLVSASDGSQPPARQVRNQSLRAAMDGGKRFPAAGTMTYSRNHSAYRDGRLLDEIQYTSSFCGFSARAGVTDSALPGSPRSRISLPGTLAAS